MSSWSGAGSFIDLDEVPFTDRRSRLLVSIAEGGGLRVRGAVYERNPADCTHLRRLVVLDGAGAELEVAEVAPEALTFGNSAASLTLAGAGGLSIGTPPDGSPVTVLLEPFAFDDGGNAFSEVDGTPVVVTVNTGTGYGVPMAGHRGGVLEVPLEPGGSLLVQVGEHEPGVLHEHAALLAAATERWTEWFGRLPTVRESDRELVRYAWWILASNIVRLYTHAEVDAVVPSKQGYVAAWQWDSYFISIGLRHGDGELAADQLRLFFAEQAPDGALPDVIHDGGTLACVADMPAGDLATLARIHGPDSPMVTEADMPITKPPLAAWAARAVDTAAGTAVQKELKDGLDRLHEWWFNRKTPDGVPGYEHVYSSGLDDSPLFDDGGPVYAPDLPSYLVVSLDAMADLAEDDGDVEAAAGLRARASQAAAHLVAQRFDPAAQSFVSLTPAGRRKTLTPFALMPLLTARLPEDIKQALVSRLDDPGALGTPFPLPTVAVSEPEFNPDRMWRGPVWLNVNWLVVQGLLRSGLEEKAAALAERTVAMAVAGDGVHEYWNPLTGRRAEGATTGFGWSAALLIDLAVWLARREHAAEPEVM